MMKKLKRLFCIIYHQYLRECGYMSDNGWYICAECYTPLSPIIGDKLKYEPEHD